MLLACRIGFDPLCRVFRAIAASGVVVLVVVATAARAAERLPATTQAASNPAEPMWVHHVQPILNKSCLKCHGGERLKGGLDLRKPQTIFSGGTDGSVVVPGRPSESPLYQRLAAGAEGHMPPDKEPQLSAEEVSLLREWIELLPSQVDHPAIAGGGSIFDQSAPSLMQMATQVKWQPPAGMGGSDA